MKPLPAAARAFADTTADICAVRRRAASHAALLDSERESLMRRLALLILLGAFSISLFAHAAGPSGSPPAAPFLAGGWGLLEASFLLLALASFAAAARLYWRYRCSSKEEQRFDHRALGEALRVQFYWIMAGPPAAAAAESMQRQRGELSWIRYLLDTMAMPLERWLAAYRRLDHASRLALLERVRWNWVRGQRDYARKTARKNAGKLRFWRHWGWNLAAGGFVNVALLLASEVSPALRAGLVEHARLAALACVLLGLAALALHVARARWSRTESQTERAEGGPCGVPFASWLLERPALLGWGLLLAASPLPRFAARARRPRRRAAAQRSPRPLARGDRAPLPGRRRLPRLERAQLPRRGRPPQRRPARTVRLGRPAAGEADRAVR